MNINLFCLSSMNVEPVSITLSLTFDATVRTGKDAEVADCDPALDAVAIGVIQHPGGWIDRVVREQVFGPALHDALGRTLADWDLIESLAAQWDAEVEDLRDRTQNIITLEDFYKDPTGVCQNIAQTLEVADPGTSMVPGGGPAKWLLEQEWRGLYTKRAWEALEVAAGFIPSLQSFGYTMPWFSWEPPERPLVSATMIVKNEGEGLPRLFASARDLVDEWIVVDTGSTDDTVTLAQEQGATIIEDEWDDDFSRSRNVSLDAATGEWSVVLDGDDELINGLRVRAALFHEVYAQAHDLPHKADPVYAMQILSVSAVEGIANPVRDDAGGLHSLSGYETMQQPRIVRTDEKFRYQYPVHNCLDLSRWTNGDPTERPPIQTLPGAYIKHYGYATPEILQTKYARTLRILQKMDPDNDHRLLFETRTLGLLNRDEEAAKCAGRMIRLHGDTLPPEVTEPWIVLARGYTDLKGDAAGALHVLADAADHNPYDPDVWAWALRAAALGLYASAMVTVKELNIGAYSSGPAAHPILSALDKLGLVEIDPEHLALLDGATKVWQGAGYTFSSEEGEEEEDALEQVL